MVTLVDLPMDILHHLAQSCSKSDILSLRLSCTRFSHFLRSYIDRQLAAEICLGSHLHLHRAVATSNTHGRIMLPRLLAANAPIEQRDKDGETALHVAARHGNLDGVYLVLDAGADVNAVSSRDWTPLHLACRYGYADIALVLLGFGANVNKTGPYGWTALHYAIQNGHGECRKVLLGYGATDTADCYCAGRTVVGVVKEQWGIYRFNATA